MSGKFMRVKKICISTLTLLVIASQLVGCASATQQEMLDMINRQQTITIEVATPISEEQGEQMTHEWVELASLDTYENFRMEVDDIMGIITHGEAGKNGVVYVDINGNHTNNSTLYYAFSNQKFIDNIWNNSDSLEKIIEATKTNYADTETDAVAQIGFLNAYFNIFADAEPNYFNANQTLTRAEFLGGVYRAYTPVYNIAVDGEFGAVVDPNGTNPDTAYAEKMEDYSYLTTENQNLNEQTFDGTITRAEAIYTLVKMFYADEFNSTTGKEKAYNDTKNGGNIAEKCDFITVDKKTDTTTYKDMWKSYELSYALQTPNKGLPTDLYKAMVVAKNHNLITGSESRWDEGITKGEALNLIVRVYETLGTQTNADRGNADGSVVANIKWEDINPKVHTVVDYEAGTITPDDTMLKAMAENCPYFTSVGMLDDAVSQTLSTLLMNYNQGYFGDDEWLDFALTGDISVLNLAKLPSDLVVENDQALEVYKEKNDKENNLDTEEEIANAVLEDVAKDLGITVEELEAIIEAERENAQANTSSNSGGGSAPNVSSNANQSNATENNYVTPSTPSDSSGLGEDLILVPGAAGDGGELIGDTVLNP